MQKACHSTSSFNDGHRDLSVASCIRSGNGSEATESRTETGADVANTWRAPTRSQCDERRTREKIKERHMPPQNKVDIRMGRTESPGSEEVCHRPRVHHARECHPVQRTMLLDSVRW